MTAGRIIRTHDQTRYPSAEEIGDEVNRLLSIVGRPCGYPKYPHEFSGGSASIAIARALSLNPQLIVCDEPVSALDVSVQAQILNLLKSLQQEFHIAYLFIAHGMAVVQHISHRVGVMYLGKLVEVASSDAIFERCTHPYTQALMSAIPIPDPELERQRTKTPLRGEVPNPINPPSGCRFHPRCPMAQEVCRRQEPLLRDIGNGHKVACHLA